MRLIRGSCHCGDIHIEISGPIYGFKHCHCKTCRKLNGTAYASNAIVKSEHFKVTRGNDCFHDYATSPRKTIRYCRKCCSPIYSFMPENAGEIYIRMGMLDDDPGIKPEYHWWVEDKASWYEINDVLPQINRVPKSL